MSKFKVGDKVRILHTDYEDCGLDVGTVHSVAAIMGGLANLEAALKDGGRDHLCFFDSELELANNTLTIGKKYTSKNGREWLCMAVDGEYAYMRLLDVPSSPAYCFKTDGTSICLGCGDWDVQFEPVRETIAVDGSFGHVFRCSGPDYITHHQQMGEHKFTMTIDMVDGEPDWSSAKLTGV